MTRLHQIIIICAAILWSICQPVLGQTVPPPPLGGQSTTAPLLPAAPASAFPANPQGDGAAVPPRPVSSSTRAAPLAPPLAPGTTPPTPNAASPAPYATGPMPYSAAPPPYTPAAGNLTTPSLTGSPPQATTSPTPGAAPSSTGGAPFTAAPNLPPYTAAAPTLPPYTAAAPPLPPYTAAAPPLPPYTASSPPLPPYTSAVAPSGTAVAPSGTAVLPPPYTAAASPSDPFPVTPPYPATPAVTATNPVTATSPGATNNPPYTAALPPTSGPAMQSNPTTPPYSPEPPPYTPATPSNDVSSQPPPQTGGFTPYETTRYADPIVPALDPNAPPPERLGADTAGSSTPRTAARAAVQEFESGRILARVNGAPVLEGDVIGLVNQVLMPRKDQMSETEYEQAKEMLTLRFLRNAIEIKMLYEKFLSTLPEDKKDKALSTIWQQVGAQFEQQELPQVLKKMESKTIKEADAKLREYGHSLAKQRRLYGEKQIGTYIMLQNINRRPEVTHDEMLAYYNENESEYAFKARARWEQLTVLFSRHGDRNEARRLIAEMGDAVFYGTPFAAVAKKGSEGFRASDGGLNDWVGQGSLASKVLDQAIFSLPLNRLSQIIEDDRGYHIIRVLEREDAGKKAFTEAQVEIKEKIQQKKREKQMQEFLEKVRKETLVTTIYDNEPEGPLMQRGAKQP